MNKKKIKELSEMTVPQEFYQMAKKEKAERKYEWSPERFPTGMYFRAEEEEEILKVAIYLTEHLKLRCSVPVYTIYFDKDDFIVWNYRDNKWSNAMLMNLSVHSVYVDKAYGSDVDKERIRDFLQTNENGLQGVVEYQYALRSKQLKQRHKKETDAWDKVMEKIPGLPKDFNRFLNKQVMKENFIFYEYSAKKEKTGYCTWCEQKVRVKNVKHNKSGKCPHCGRPVKFKSSGRQNVLLTGEYVGYILQPFEQDKMVQRTFLVRHKYVKSNWEKGKISICENTRVIISPDGKFEVYAWDYYKDKRLRWIKESSGKLEEMHTPYDGIAGGKCYRKNLKALEKISWIQRTGLLHMVKQEDIIPCQYLIMVRKSPVTEQFVKAGLYQLTKEMADKWRLWSFDSMKRELISLEEVKGSLAKTLEIDSHMLKTLRQYNGGFLCLSWLQYLKKKNLYLEERYLKWLCENHIEPEDYEKMPVRLSIVKTVNYLKKQMVLLNLKAEEVRNTWDDYLYMAIRLGMDVNNILIVKPKNLKVAHDTAMKMGTQADMAKEAFELSRKYPNAEQVMQEKYEKYQYHDKNFAILTPKKIEDILLEGEKLGHCIGSGKGERYFQKIQDKISYLVFLRRKPDIDKPYYTLEIEPNGTIRQARTVGDNQNEDYQVECLPFLRKWQEVVQKRMTEEDLEEQKTSEFARKEEYSKIRKDKVKIWNGKLKGQLLADILEKDLILA